MITKTMSYHKPITDLNQLKEGQIVYAVDRNSVFNLKQYKNDDYLTNWFINEHLHTTKEAAELHLRAKQEL